MKANEFISELFHGNKQWQWTFQGDEQSTANFEIGGVPYKFIAIQDSYEAPGDWEIEFTATVASSGDPTWAVTGTGNAAEVFGTVVDIMKSFIADKGDKIRRLTFAAKEGSRQGLYAKMVKRLLPSWDLQHHGGSFTVTKPGIEFWVYSLQFPEIPAVKVKARHAREAETVAMNTIPQFKDADYNGMIATSRPPKR
jgi:hypothetical protein